jgi:hypothetical protein
LKDLDTSVFYGGVLDGIEGVTDVQAHIDRGVLVAHILTDEGPYFLERADTYMANPSFSNIFYKGSDMTSNATDSFHGGALHEGSAYEKVQAMSKHSEEMNQQDPDFLDRYYAKRNMTQRNRERREQRMGRGGNRQRRTFDMEKHNTCFVGLVADHTYVNSVADGDAQRAISLMTQNVAGATLIYKYTNFYKGIGKGISFAIKRFYVYTSADDLENPFRDQNEFSCGAEADDSSLCSAVTPCAQHYLSKLASWGGGNTPFTDLCTVPVFRQKFTLEDAIGSHACSLEARACV